MAKEITPIVPALPPTTAIQDPAVRNFCRAVADALRSMQSAESSVAALTQALESVAGGSGGAGPADTVTGNGNQYGVPQFTVNSILRSRLFGALSRTIDRIPLTGGSGDAEKLVAAEASARQAAIDALNARVTSLENADVYDPEVPYNEGDIVQYDGGLYRATEPTTGNLPTNTAYWEKIGDYASIGDAVAALAAEVSDHDTRITNNDGAITAEATARNALAVQLRGNYTGTDVAALSQGLIHSERQARVSAVDAVTTTLNTQISRINAAEAAISSEATTRATNDTALVQAINTAWAITGATQAVQQVGSNLVTNWTTAQANYWSQLDAEVFTSGGQTIRAALSNEASVRASADGHLFGQYSVKVDLNGYVTGYGFSSTANNGTPDSEFIVLANRFAVVTPGGTPIVPFVVEGLTTYINNAVIKKGNIFDLTVGNEIKSDDFVAGSAGWRVQRGGNAEFRNILARGNIEATSIKADAAEIVTTLMLANNSVSVANAATGTAGSVSTTLNVPSGETWKIVLIGFQDGTSSNGNPDWSTNSLSANGKSTSLITSIYQSETPIHSLQAGSVANVVTVSGPATYVATVTGATRNVGGNPQKTILAIGFRK